MHIIIMPKLPKQKCHSNNLIPGPFNAWIVLSLFICSFLNTVKTVSKVKPTTIKRSNKTVFLQRETERIYNISVQKQSNIKMIKVKIGIIWKFTMI